MNSTLNSTVARLVRSVEERVENVELALSLSVGSDDAAGDAARAVHAEVAVASSRTRHEIATLQDSVAALGNEMKELKKGLATITLAVEEQGRGQVGLEARIALLERGNGGEGGHGSAT